MRKSDSELKQVQHFAKRDLLRLGKRSAGAKKDKNDKKKPKPSRAEKKDKVKALARTIVVSQIRQEQAESEVNNKRRAKFAAEQIDQTEADALAASAQDMLKMVAATQQMVVQQWVEADACQKRRV